jgi:hypothetical protein
MLDVGKNIIPVKSGKIAHQAAVRSPGPDWLGVCWCFFWVSLGKSGKQRAQIRKMSHCS